MELEAKQSQLEARRMRGELLTFFEQLPVYHQALEACDVSDIIGPLQKKEQGSQEKGTITTDSLIMLVSCLDMR